MKRYFDVPEQRVVVEFEMVEGSPAATASTEVFEKEFKTKMIEISKEGHKRLSKEYERGE